MNNTLDKYFGYFIIAFIIFSLGFFSGLVWTSDRAYNLGYKMAYSEIDVLLQEGIQGSHDFYVKGIDIRFRPLKDRKALVIAYEKKNSNTR